MARPARLTRAAPTTSTPSAGSVGVSAADLDEGHLAAIMKVFANPGRVQLLKILVRPHALSEIHLPPQREGGPAMSRQALTEHLQQLVAAGAVRQWPQERDGRLVQVFQVNHAQLFALTEKLRDLGRIHPEGARALDGTMVRPAAPVPAAPAVGPSLTAVNGAREGTRFALRGKGPWTIGRAPQCDVCLDYDPFLSLENSEVSRAPDGFRIRTLAKSRNGTTVNWHPVPESAPRPLQPGDVVGVGRTTLLWRPD